MTRNLPSRRSFAIATAGLAGAAAGLLPGLTRAEGQAAAATTEILEPFGGRAVANLAMTVLSPALERESGRAIKLTPISDGSRTVETIIEQLNAAPTDGSMLGVLAVLSGAMGGLYGEKATLSSLVPIAKLTRGWSEALFVGADSTLKSWADFAAAASHGTLKVATFDRSTVSYLTVLMMKQYAKIAVESVVTRSPAETTEAVRNGAAVAGVLPTPSLLSLDTKLRPLLTFGAARNPTLAAVPTLAETVNDRHAAFTECVAVYGPEKMPAAVASRWTQFFLHAGNTASAKHDAAAQNVDLAIEGPGVLRETMARNTRLLQRIVAR